MNLQFTHGSKCTKERPFWRMSSTMDVEIYQFMFFESLFFDRHWDTENGVLWEIRRTFNTVGRMQMKPLQKNNASLIPDDMLMVRQVGNHVTCVEVNCSWSVIISKQMVCSTLFRIKIITIKMVEQCIDIKKTMVGEGVGGSNQRLITDPLMCTC